MDNNCLSEAGVVLVSDVYPDNIAVLPLENRPIFPGLGLPLSFVNEEMVQLVDYALKKNNGFIGTALIKTENEEQFLKSDLYRMGTLLKIVKVMAKTSDSVSFFAQALIRFEHVRAV